MKKNKRNFRNLSGEIISSWKILKEHDSLKNEKRYLCQCLLCQKECIVSKSSLLTKKSKCCIECSWNKKRDQSLVPKFLLHKYQSGAKLRNIKFNLNQIDLIRQFQNQSGLCALTGQKLIMPRGNSDYHTGKFTASLDRIDSDIGYVKDNIQWIHKDINQIKFYFGQSEFIKMCELVADFHRRIK